VDGHRISCSVDPEGLPPVLDALTRAGVLSLTSAPPSLEELFLDAYRSSPGDAAVAAHPS
jgi:ABC-2 type transport system ATP-binding protein